MLSNMEIHTSKLKNTKNKYFWYGTPFQGLSKNVAKHTNVMRRTKTLNIKQNVSKLYNQGENQ